MHCLCRAGAACEEVAEWYKVSLWRADCLFPLLIFACLPACPHRTLSQMGW